MLVVYLGGIAESRNGRERRLRQGRRKGGERVCFHICCDKQHGLDSSGISGKHAASQHCPSEEQERGYWSPLTTLAESGPEGD